MAGTNLASDVAGRLKDQVEPFSIAWYKIVNDYPPLEVKCIQDGSGSNDLDEDDTFLLPPGWKRVYHGTYVSKLESILSNAGLLCGGLLGENHRNRMYALP